MRSIEQNLALGPGEVETPKPSFVDSYTFREYTLAVSPWNEELMAEQPYNNFATSLYLPYLYQFSKEIAQAPNVVNIHDETIRNKVNSRDHTKLTRPILRFVQLLITANEKRIVEQRAKGERSRDVGYDFSTDKWVATAISRGKYDMVRSGDNTIEDSEVSFNPDETIRALQIHTHPTDAFFSRTDFSSLLLVEGERRYTRASLVICPSVQILALATKNTPLVKSEEALDEMKEKWLEEISMEDSLALVSAQIDSDMKLRKMNDYFVNLEPEVLPQLLELERMREQFNLDVGVVADAFYAICTTARPAFKAELGEIGDEIDKKDHELKKVENHQTNAFLVNLGRRLNLRLYTSTDMLNYTAFSA